MRGTWQTTGGGAEAVGGVAGVAVAAAAVWLLLQVLWILAVVAGVLLAVSVPALIWLARRGPAIAAGGGDAPQRWAIAVARERQALPAAQPVQALPGPQTVNYNNYNFYGYTPEQVAEAAARQQRSIEGR